jgi:hypothetical protein
MVIEPMQKSKKSCQQSLIKGFAFGIKTFTQPLSEGIKKSFKPEGLSK